MLALLVLACASEGVAPKADTDGDGVPDAADCAPDDPTASVPTRRHRDADGDGYGRAGQADSVCPTEPGWVDDDTDCDDNAAGVHPGAEEIWYDGADEDCSGGGDFDQDQDGEDVGGDCDDRDARRYPGAPELCDGADNTCDTRWTAASEAGTASERADDGTWRDVTEAWAAGTEREPVSVQLPADGTLYLCAGSWYARASLGDTPGSVSVVGRVDGGEVIIDGGGVARPFRLIGTTGETAVELRNLHIQSGEADLGGGLYAEGVALQLTNVSITDSVATSSGGGAYVTDGSLTLTGGSLTGNRSDGPGATYGGALAWRDSGDASLTIDGTRILDNGAFSQTGTAWGGGLYAEASGTGSLTLTGLRVEGNQARSESGGAIAGGAYLSAAGGGDVTITDSQLLANQAAGTSTSYGGGLGVAGETGAGALTLESSLLRDNVLYGPAASSGGGLIVGTAFLTANIRDTILDGNGIYTEATGAINGYGGGAQLSLAGGTTIVSDSVLTDNEAAHAAGLGMELSGGADVTLADTNVEDNLGDGVRYVAGGASERLTLAGGSVSGNTATGIALQAATGNTASLLLSNHGGSDVQVAGNRDGIQLTCSGVGGACTVSSTAVDFVGDRGRNAACDVSADGSCAAALGDDVTLSCMTVYGRTDCVW